MADITIKTIQFKRGSKATLESKLVEGDLGVPAAGEPIFERDNNKLKIGDGVHDYASLPYLTGSGGGGADDRFVIVDPLADDLLIYDDDLGYWVNKPLNEVPAVLALLRQIGESASSAANSAATAAADAASARAIKDDLDSEFWHGTLEEYNALDSIEPGAFYFVRAVGGE